jgi:hypothetical protein
VTKLYEGKTDFLSIRVPRELREKIEWAVNLVKKAKKQSYSQSDFYLAATLSAIEKLEKGKAVVLPKEFAEIPTEDRKMVSIRVPPDVLPQIQAFAPRLFHTQTRFVLWAATVKVYELYAAQQKKKAKKKTS